MSLTPTAIGPEPARKWAGVCRGTIKESFLVRGALYNIYPDNQGANELAPATVNNTKKNTGWGNQNETQVCSIECLKKYTKPSNLSENVIVTRSLCATE